MRNKSDRAMILEAFVVTRERGVLKTWDDGKGFGFIKPDKDESPEIFFHVTEIRNRIPRRPQQGDVVYYHTTLDERSGKSRACDVHLVSVFEVDEKPKTKRYSDTRIGSWLFCIPIIMFPVCCTTYLWRMNGNYYPLAVYLVASVITVLMYQEDKRSAQYGGWRISEARLHFAELLGGWPGALIAQRLFRHKTVKVEYLFVFWLIVIIHVAGWVDHLAFQGEMRNAIGRNIVKISNESRR